MFVTELVEYLRAEGVGTPNAPINGLFYSSKALLPTGSGPFVVLRETGGVFEERTQNAVIMPAYVRPGAQVVVHGSSYNAAHGLSRLARYSLGKVRNQLVGMASFTVTLTRVGSTVTATSLVDHRFLSGMPIRISGAVQGTYNGDVEITAVPTPRTLTYVVAGTPTTPATGAITAAFLGTWYREIGIEQEPFDLGVDTSDRARVVFNIVAVKRPS